MKRWIAALLLALLTTGCATVPISGPVEEVPLSDRPGGIDIAPQPPATDVTPARLIEGFLQAMADPADDYAIARAYLTAEAGATWDTSTAVIYTGAVRADEGSAGIEGTTIGTLDPSGRFTSAPASMDFTFDLVREDGQWRIRSAPAGLMLSRYLFERYYERVPLYFVSRVGLHVAPDLVHLPESQLTPATVVDALLKGPPASLAGPVYSAIDSSVMLGDEGATIDSQGIVKVDLTGLDPKLGEQQRRLLGAQLLWTLTSLPRVTGLLVTQDGMPFALPGANAEGVVELAAQHVYQVLSRAVGADLFVIQGAEAGWLREDGMFEPFPTPAEVADIAVSADGETMAFIGTDRTSLTLGPVDGERVDVPTGLTQLRSPQFVLGTLWLLGDDEEGRTRLLTVDRLHQVSTVSLTVPQGSRLEGFAVSPTRTRMVMILGSQGERRLTTGTIVGTNQVSVSRPSPLPLTTPGGVQLVDVRSVAWPSETSIVVVAAAGLQSVYTAQADGSGVEEIGPLVGGVDDVTAQARLGGGSIAAHTESGAVWRYEARTRWTMVAEEITAIAFSG